MIFSCFCAFFMSRCDDCIFHRAWKNRVENAVAKVFNNKISKNIRVFLKKFCRNVCFVLLCLFFKLVYFFYDLITLNLRETKRETWDTFFSFIAIMLGCSLYSNIAFINGSSIFRPIYFFIRNNLIR